MGLKSTLRKGLDAVFLRISPALPHKLQQQMASEQRHHFFSTMNISKLSSRLLAGRNTPSSTGSDSKNGAAPSRNSGGGHSSCSGGYSADREGSVSSPPGHIDLQVKHKRHFLSSNEDRTKRRKLNELQYTATVAKADILRAGQTVPVLRASRPRAISLGKVDTSRVKFVFSKEVQSSPFLIPLSAGSSTSGHNQISAPDYDVYSQMLDACKELYATAIAGTDGAVTGSATSSFSDSVDTLISTKTEEDVTPKNGKIITERPTPLIPEVSMTMEEALGFCNYSRYAFNFSILPHMFRI